jgi:hypothetical protein
MDESIRQGNGEVKSFLVLAVFVPLSEGPAIPPDG